MTGVELIAAERQRQQEVEGWTPEHDRAHGRGELVKAAMTYLSGEPGRWPWDHSFLKLNPGNQIRDLVKAGALIAAEIDRLSAPAPQVTFGEPKVELETDR